jgi:hypothetical protein
MRLSVTAFFRRKKKTHLRRLHLFVMAFLKKKSENKLLRVASQKIDILEERENKYQKVEVKN